MEYIHIVVCDKLGLMLKLIAAVGKNMELGNAGDLPLWKLRADMDRFKNLTSGEVVVMGRKTFESFPPKFRPLPNRRNIILTRDLSYKVDGAEVFNSFESFLEQNPNEENIWIIGGGEIYRQFVNKVDELHITHVDGEFEADTRFPIIDTNIWKVSKEEFIPTDEKNSHNSTYRIYERA